MTVKIEMPDGTIVEFPDIETAQAVLSKQNEPPPPNTNPGVQADAPPEMFFNPQTGQYTSRELLSNAMDPSRAEAAQIGAMQGLSFGGADEIMGGAAAVTDGPVGYTYGREYTRAAEEAARRDFPVTTTGSEIAGGATTALTYGLPAWSRLGMTGTPGAMAGGAIVGAGEGVGYGFLSGEGSARDRVVRALMMAGLGGATGGLMPVVTSLARSAGHAVGDAVMGGVERVAGKGSQSRANRALTATMNRAGQTPDEIGMALMRAAQDGQGTFTAADALGQAGQRRMSGIVRAGGDASQEIADFLRQRQLDQPERVAGFVEDAFDASRTAASTDAALRAARKDAADKAFAAAAEGAKPVDVRQAVAILDDTIGQMSNSGIRPPAVVKEFQKVRAKLAGMTPDGDQTTLSDYQSVLQNYRELRDQIDMAFQNGGSGAAVGDALKPVRDALEQALSDASDGFRAAQADYRRASGVIDAVDEGAQMARPGARAADTTARFNSMTPDQQAAARVGYGDKSLAKIEASAGEMTNRARPFTSTKARAEAEAMATDPALFLRRIDREGVMHDTMGRALGGSRTADNLADIEDLAPYDTGTLVNLLTGQWRTAAQQGLQGASNALTGMNPGTRQIVAKALMARDETAFRKALAQAETADARKEVVDAILRIGAQRTGYAGSVQP